MAVVKYPFSAQITPDLHSRLVPSFERLLAALLFSRNLRVRSCGHLKERRICETPEVLNGFQP